VDEQAIREACEKCRERIRRDGWGFQCPVLEAMEPEYKLEGPVTYAQGWKMWVVRSGRNVEVGWVMVGKSSTRIYSLEPEGCLKGFYMRGHPELPLYYVVGTKTGSEMFEGGIAGEWASTIDRLLEKEGV